MDTADTQSGPLQNKGTALMGFLSGRRRLALGKACGGVKAGAEQHPRARCGPGMLL